MTAVYGARSAPAGSSSTQRPTAVRSDVTAPATARAPGVSPARTAMRATRLIRLAGAYLARLIGGSRRSPSRGGLVLIRLAHECGELALVHGVAQAESRVACRRALALAVCILLDWRSSVVRRILLVEHSETGLVGGSLTGLDRKSTRLNSSHITISYAVFCL